MNTAEPRGKIKQTQVVIFTNVTISVFILTLFVRSLSGPYLYQSIGIGILLVALYVMIVLLLIKNNKLKKQLHES